MDCVLRKANPREMRRELVVDVRNIVDRWERRLELVEQEAPAKLKGVR